MYAAMFAAGAAWTLSLLLRSPGVANHDEVTHTLIARLSWRHPTMVLDQWGRVGHTLLYVIPSLGGLTGARVMSLLLSCLTVLAATKLAHTFGVQRLWLVPLFLWFQPWFNDVGYTAMTEVPFALGLTAAVLCAVQQRWSLAAVITGTLPLIRNESIVYVGLLGLVLLAGRRWKPLALMLVPELLYNVLYLLAHGRLGAGNFAHADHGSFYGHGGWSYYVPGAWHGIGAVVTVLAGVGCLVAVRRGRNALWLLAYPIWFALHTVVYHYGLYASGGYIVFLTPLAPGAAILAALAVDTAGTQLRAARAAPNVLRATGIVAAGALIAVTAAIGLRTDPHPLDGDGQVMRDTAHWIDDHGYGSRPVITTHPWFAYFHHYGRQQMLSGTFDAAKVRPDTLLVWDLHYSSRYGIDYALLTPANGWVLLYHPNGLAAVFERRTGSSNTG